MRKLTVNGVEYRLTIGRGSIKIVSEGGTCAPHNDEIIGVTPDAFERGQHKKTRDGMVTPGRVAYWIRKNSWRFTPMKTERTLRLRQPNYDEVLHFGGYFGTASQCGIRIWTDGPRGATAPTRYIIMMTELADNPGTSVTNACEMVATEVLLTMLPKADPDLITWIEHWPPRGLGTRAVLPETFDFVYLKYDGVKFRMDTVGVAGTRHPWKRMTADDLRELGILL
jgi:hypothetical protein